jgi:hypothetical protein
MMPVRLTAGFIALLMLVVACGSPPSILSSGPTASSVAVQPGDLPGGLKKCALSGDIDSYLNKVRTKDPNTYNSTKAEWEAAKKQGATAAQTAFYSDTVAHCDTIVSSTADVTGATYKIVVNFVIEFKDEASATKGYTSESIFGVSASSLKSSSAPGTVVEGTKTGLTANSVVLTLPVPQQTFYVAVWQNKVFMVILAILNIDPAMSKKVAIAENARIK